MLVYLVNFLYGIESLNIQANYSDVYHFTTITHNTKLM